MCPGASRRNGMEKGGKKRNGGTRWLGRDARFLDGERREEELAVRHDATDGNRAKRREVKPGPLSCGEDHVRSHTLPTGSRSPAGALRGNNKGVKFRNERQSVGFIVRKRTGFAYGRKEGAESFGLVIRGPDPASFFQTSNLASRLLDNKPCNWDSDCRENKRHERV